MPLAAKVDEQRRRDGLAPAHGPAGALMPIDSEHGAIYQCLIGEEHREVERLWVTASGGPFRGKTHDELREITPAQATVKADDKDKILGCSEPALTATLSGLFGDDTVSYTLARESGEAVGTYTITPTVTSSANPNYVVTPVNGTFTIGTPASCARSIRAWQRRRTVSSRIRRTISSNMS